MKKIVVLLMCFVFMMSFGAFANEDIKTEITLQRDFINADSSCTVIVNAVANTDVTYLVTYSDTDVEGLPVDTSLTEDIIYMYQEKANGEGASSITFDTSKTNSKCTIVVKGQLYSADATAGDEIAEVNYSSAYMYERINQAGASCTLNITGTPGSSVSIMILNENEAVIDLAENTSLTDKLQSVYQITLDGDGKGVYTFEATQSAGICKIRLMGDITNVTTVTTDNAVTEADSGDYFAVAHTATGEYTGSVISVPKLSYDSITKYGVEAMAKTIKYKLDSMPKGRKVLFLAPDFMNVLQEDMEDVIFFTTGPDKVKNAMDSFFKEFYLLGGNVDFVYSDFEMGFSNWYFENKYGSNEKDLITEALAAIVNNPKYQTLIRPSLAERNYVFGGQTSEIEDVAYWNSPTSDAYKFNYVIWNGVMEEYVAEYLDDCFYSPIKKYFVNVKYSDYGRADTSGAYSGYYSKHPEYAGGNTSKVGTHSSEVLYGNNLSDIDKDMDGVEDKNLTSFDILSNAVRHLQGIKATNAESKMMTWVHSYKNDTVLKDSSYYYEELYHTLMYDPEPLLFFGPYHSGADETVNDNYNAVKFAVDTINSILGNKRGNAMAVPQASVYQNYVVSGIEAEDKIVWRYTWDNAYKMTQSTVDGNLVFTVNDQEVIFPSGTIINVSDYENTVGCFIETPLNTQIIQNINTATLTNGILNATVKFFNKKTGTVTSAFSKETEYTAVVKFMNKSSVDENATLYIAEYNGNKLINAQSLSKAVKKGSDGTFSFDLGVLDSETTKIGLYLWNDNLTPLAAMLKVE